jgi:hypothetical protein
MMASLVEPIEVLVRHKAGKFIAGSAYYVGKVRRVRTASASTPADALDRLLRKFRDAGHAGKRYTARGVELDLQGAIGGKRK